MAVKTVKPTSPGRRAMVLDAFDDIDKVRPEKTLVEPLKSNAGRNHSGRITTRHRGGGVKRAYRIIDFKRNKLGIPASVKTIEYDPNRSSRIALLHYHDGEKRYIIAPLGLQRGDVIQSGPEAEVRVGNALPLGVIPTGTTVHNIEIHLGKGGQLVRGAGTGAQVMAHEEKYTLLRLPSSELRRVLSTCYATIGQVGNQDHKNLSHGARRAASGSRGGARLCEAPRCRHATIHTAAARVVRPSGCRGRNRRGASRHWARRRAGTRSRTCLSSGDAVAAEARAARRTKPERTENKER